MLFWIFVGTITNSDPSITHGPFPIERVKVATKTHVATFTAYTKHCKGCSGVMANGEEAIGAWVAADRHWKFGACLEYYYKGSWHRVTVGDRGGAIKGRHRFDVLVASSKEARDFGKRRLEYRRCND